MKKLLLGILPFLYACTELASTEVPNEIQISLSGSGIQSSALSQQNLYLLDSNGMVLNQTRSDSLGHFEFSKRIYHKNQILWIKSEDSSLKALWLAGADLNQISLSPFSTLIANNPLPKGQVKKFKDSLSTSWFGPGFEASPLNQSSWNSDSLRHLVFAFHATLWSMSQDKVLTQALKQSFQNHSTLYDSQVFLARLATNLEFHHSSLDAAADLLSNLSQRDNSNAWKVRLQTARE